jgi:hypothetical protein
MQLKQPALPIYLWIGTSEGPWRPLPLLPGGLEISKRTVLVSISRILNLNKKNLFRHLISKVKPVSSRVSIGNILRQKHQRHWHASITIVLALATLGDTIQIEMILSVSHRPRWPRQVQSCDCRMLLLLTVSLTNVVNVNDPLGLIYTYVWFSIKLAGLENIQ